MAKTRKRRRPVWEQLSTCQGKASFASPRIAWDAARRKSGREAYRCPCCGQWHVGRKHR